MKKLLVCVFMVLFLVGMGQIVLAEPIWHSPDQSTMGWTPSASESLLASGEILTYTVHLRNASGGPSIEQQTGLVAGSNEIVVTFPAPGAYFAGVQAIVSMSGSTIVQKSPIVWSDDPVYAKDGEEFGWLNLTIPEPPSDLFKK